MSILVIDRAVTFFIFLILLLVTKKTQMEIPELLLTIIQHTLSESVKIRELQSCMRMRLVSRYFLSVVDLYVIPNVKRLSRPIINIISLENLVKYKGLEFFDATWKPEINEEILDNLTNIKTFVLSFKQQPILPFLKKMTNLTDLSLWRTGGIRLTNELSCLKNLTRLDLCDSKVTNSDISILTNLKILVSNGNPHITTDVLTSLIGITDLEMDNQAKERYCLTNYTISSLESLRIIKDTNYSPEIKISHFINLRQLILVAVNDFQGIEKLTKLETLVIKQPMHCMMGLSQLTNLKCLMFENMMHQNRIYDYHDIMGTTLTSLTQLHLDSIIIGNDTLSRMTKLKILRLNNNGQLLDTSISQLTNLQSLHLTSSSPLSFTTLLRLQSLTSLNNSQIDFVETSITRLTSLRNLYFSMTKNFDMDLLLNLPYLDIVSLASTLDRNEVEKITKKFWKNGISFDHFHLVC